MISLAECDQEVIKGVTDIEDFLYDKYGNKSFSLYAFRDGKQMLYISKKGLKCFYIKPGKAIKFRKFMIDNEGNLVNYINNGMIYGVSDYNGYEVTRMDNNRGIESSLRFVYDNVDDDYGGLVVFTQRKNNGDICEIHYNHPLNLRLSNGECKLFSFHLKKYNFVSLEEINKECIQHRKMIKEFKAEILEERTLSYKIGSWKEKKLGRREFRERKELVYMPIWGFTEGDSYARTWPLGEQYREEQIKEMVRLRGFLDSVPREMIELYNQEGEYDNYQKLQNICEQMRNVSSESKKKMLVNLRK